MQDQILLSSKDYEFVTLLEGHKHEIMCGLDQEEEPHTTLRRTASRR